MKRKPICPACGSGHVAEMTWVLTLAYIENIQDDKAAPDGVRIEYTGETYHTESEKSVKGDKFHCGDCGYEFAVPNWYEYITIVVSQGNSYQLKEEEFEVLVKYHGIYGEEKIATLIDDYVAEWVDEHVDDTLVWGWKRQ